MISQTKILLIARTVSIDSRKDPVIKMKLTEVTGEAVGIAVAAFRAEAEEEQLLYGGLGQANLDGSVEVDLTGAIPVFCFGL